MCFFLLLSILLVSSEGSECPRAYIDGGQGSCYFVSHDEVTWTEAMISCQILEGYLVEIETQAEFDNIRSLLLNRTSQASVWVALSDKRQDKIWEWATSHTIYDPQAAEFDMWSPGEPDHYSKDGTEDCALLDYFHGDGKSHDFQLADVQCSREELYVCEHKKLTQAVVVG
ncbi:C-type lectin domain family 10 member A-like [Mya arenaria]|uniref:C-type lectin domain family 10 member A-like n=1 Tax=Mya arenaria TaxID=6604 RepID=UPI0022E4620F|nr:C-type lectin domain family 10 member A-like [Mya arenaria]